MTMLMTVGGYRTNFPDLLNPNIHFIHATADGSPLAGASVPFYQDGEVLQVPAGFTFTMAGFQILNHDGEAAMSIIYADDIDFHVNIVTMINYSTSLTEQYSTPLIETFGIGAPSGKYIGIRNIGGESTANNVYIVGVLIPIVGGDPTLSSWSMGCLHTEYPDLVNPRIGICTAQMLVANTRYAAPLLVNNQAYRIPPGKSFRVVGMVGITQVPPAAGAATDVYVVSSPDPLANLTNLTWYANFTFADIKVSYYQQFDLVLDKMPENHYVGLLYRNNTGLGTTSMILLGYELVIFGKEPLPCGATDG